MKKDAVISEDEVYRYSLLRIWEEDEKRMLFIMLNPSTADAKEDDPTVRWCIGFAKREGCTSLEIVNLFAYRATEPKDLLEAAKPIGISNGAGIREALHRASIVVCAWGASLNNWTMKYMQIAHVMGEIYAAGKMRKCFCLGSTQGGQPKHPVRLAADTKLEQMMFV